MIAKAHSPLQPTLSASQIVRRKNKIAKRAGLESSRAVHRLVDEEQKRMSGKPTKAERRVRGAELAAARKAKNKAERVDRRPRPVLTLNVARKPVPVANNPVPGVVSKVLVGAA